MLSDLGENLLRSVHGIDRKGLPGAHKANVLVRDDFEDGIVLRVVRQAVAQVAHLAPIDSVVPDQWPQPQHLPPVRKLVEEGA